VWCDFELEVSQFRAIKRASLTLSPLTVLVGRNGCGKSSLLQALQLIAFLNPTIALEAVVRRDFTSPEATRWLFHRRSPSGCIISVKSVSGDRSLGMK
jgi:predicted ATP-dependent endonuclease of OLD family